MNKYSIPFFLLCILCLTLTNVNAQNIREDETLDLLKVYGYFYGQSKTLNKIKSEYPGIRDRATMAELMWINKFGPTRDEVESRLKEILADDFGTILSESMAKYDSYSSKNNFSKDDAIAFIEKVQRRSRGEIEDDMQELILMYHPAFIKHPHREFSEGFTKEFISTGNEAKSKGLRLRIKYPMSWKLKDGAGPNVPFKVVSKGGEGDVSMNFVIRDMRSYLESELDSEDVSYLVSQEGNKELAEYMFVDEFIKNMVKEYNLEDAEFGEINTLNIYGNPAASFNYCGKKRKLDFLVPLCAEQYLIICKHYFIVVSFSTPGETIRLAEMTFQKYNQLKRLMISSLVIYNTFE